MKITVIKSIAASIAPMLCLSAIWIGCGGGPATRPESPELLQLRADNAEVEKLRRENAELPKLRNDNQELQRLRGTVADLSRLRSENTQMRQELTAKGEVLPPSEVPVAAVDEVPKREPIHNLVQAFDDIAAAIPPDNIRDEDVPKEGDTLLIGQDVIGLLIPEFDENTNGGPYEISGWLKAKGVTVRNYQQLNLLGITNYKVMRAPPARPDAPKP
jgi:hypothetical protein